MQRLIYHKMYIDVPDPEFATPGSACFDIRAYFGTHTRMFRVFNEKNTEMTYMAFQMLQGEQYHTVLNPGDRALIPSGLIFDIPQGHSIRCHGRSGLALKSGLALPHGEGIVDEDYVEQFFIPIVNNSKVSVRINHGDRIAQLEMVPTLDYTMELAEGPVLERKTNRCGGFGHSGVA